MERVEVRTQVEFDAAVKAGNIAVCISGYFEARGSSHVVAWGSSHVEARGNVFIRLFSCLKIQAGIHVLIMDHGSNESKITGGKTVKAFKPKTALQWCTHWGVKVEKKIAILFKGLNKNNNSPRGFSYTPGTIPTAPDWDGGKKECGGGLHFSPVPKMTNQYCSEPPDKYMACPVALKDIVVHPNGLYPDKIKARGCCAPVWECDEDGNKI